VLSSASAVAARASAQGPSAVTMMTPASSALSRPMRGTTKATSASAESQAHSAEGSRTAHSLGPNSAMLAACNQ